MRIIIGVLGIAAALAFVVYSAVTTYWVAHDMNSQFQQLAGGAAAGMVVFEALGLLFVRQCWHNGARLMAIGGLALVLAATVYIVRLDLRFHIAGQSDITATREASIDRREVAREEYDRARNRRNDLGKLKTLSKDQREEARRLDKRIAELEPRIWAPDIIASAGMPEASWASRMLGRISTDRQWWTDALMVLGILFWALARMMALPLAVSSLTGARPSNVQKMQNAAFAQPEPDILPEPRQKPQEPRKQEPLPMPQKNPSRRPHALSRIVDGLSRLWGGKTEPEKPFGPPRLVEKPVVEVHDAHPAAIDLGPRPRKPRQSQEDRIAQQQVESWINVRFRREAGKVVTVLAAHKDFEAWALSAGFEAPVTLATFVQAMKEYEIAPRDTGKGKVYDGVIVEKTKRRAG